MAIKPILFNGEMVKAILDGRKTQTRRLVKPHYHDGDAGFNVVTMANTGAFCYIEYYDEDERSTERRLNTPYNRDDILWVRETWTSEAGRYYYRADFEGDFLDPCETLSGGYPGSCIGKDCNFCYAQPKRICWHPSIHMPRKAARIFLRVTDVYAERLHDMTERDAEKEGIGNLYLEDVGFGDKDYGCVPYEVGKGYAGLQLEQFAHLWDSTIKKDDLPRYGWESNPWVWVIEFERTEQQTPF